MNDRWINTISLISGLGFGVLGTFISLQPSEAELKLLASQKEMSRIAIGKAVHGYLDDVESISKIQEPNARLATLLKFENKILYLKASRGNHASDLFKQIEGQKKAAQMQILSIEKANVEAEKTRIIGQQKAAESARQKQIEAEKKAAQIGLQRELQRERICLNRNCSSWILP